MIYLLGFFVVAAVLFPRKIIKAINPSAAGGFWRLHIKEMLIDTYTGKTNDLKSNQIKLYLYNPKS